MESLIDVSNLSPNVLGKYLAKNIPKSASINMELADIYNFITCIFEKIKYISTDRYAEYNINKEKFHINTYRYFI